MKIFFPYVTFILYDSKNAAILIGFIGGDSKWYGTVRNCGTCPLTQYISFIELLVF